ncbi:Detected protein of unknown function [Hibiscus syriacus]|uniref:C2H2-type domain-containing protein n=1 Tax=Hibiscus syriacus TaxID=106335 RepID=A0A6A2Z6P6_HIBSY|nr:uncharacterized protein LOC120150006 [Hibiscus syriacus]KAE8687664.1 Detected protein of unknown function [Hibiscus syriacus]
MDFKFRAVDYQPSNSFPSSSSSFNPSLSGDSGQIFRPYRNVILGRPETVEWDKLQIRDEIIASEIARRRALEAEVRRELMAEREMAAQQRFRETGLSYEQSFTMRLDSRLPFVPHLHSLKRWRTEACFNMFPPALLPPLVVLPPPVTETLDSQVKDTSEDKRNKLIILPKPDPNRVLGAKRKPPPPAETSELRQLLISSKVKQNDEWKCGICKINVTSEKTLAEHLGGKKHKANEARQKARKTEENSDPSTDIITLQKKLKQSDEIGG